jgi:DNA-binding CsgD family transcriptional regulator
MAMQAGRSVEVSHQFEQLFDQIKPENYLTQHEIQSALLRAAHHYYLLDQMQKAVHHQQEALELARHLNDDNLTAATLCFGKLCQETAPQLYPGSESFSTSEMTNYAEQYAASRFDWVRLLIKQGRYTEAWQRVRQSRSAEYLFAETETMLRRISALYAFTSRGYELETIVAHYEQALAETSGEGHTLFHLLLLSGFAWHQLRLNHMKKAGGLLEEALVLVEKTGYIRTILDIPELAAILRKATHPIAAVLLRQMEQEVQLSKIASLTSQERVVLRLLARDYKYRMIADEQHISINTVRFHVRNIYTKLGVSRRYDAVQRARKVGLIKG